MLFHSSLPYPNMTAPQMLTFLLTICAAFLCVSSQFNNFNKYELPAGVTGPVSATFRQFGGLLPQGPFTTVVDGRILKWQGPGVGFQYFAYTSPIRTRQLCDGTTDPDLGPVCGRPLALSFHPIFRHFYIVDAYFGLLAVGPNGQRATQLARGFKFPLGLDIDLMTGIAYFIDASLTYEIRNITQPGFKPDSTGRLLRYNPFTREVSVLISGLFGGGGPAVSSDGTYVVVPELYGKRISKYWLVGPKANTMEPLLTLAGNPNKIKRAGRSGEFWVAVSNGLSPPMPPIVPQGVRFNSDGVVLQTVSFAKEYFNKSITLVQEQEGKLYVGARGTNFIGVYSN